MSPAAGTVLATASFGFLSSLAWLHNTITVGPAQVGVTVHQAIRCQTGSQISTAIPLVSRQDLFAYGNNGSFLSPYPLQCYLCGSQKKFLQVLGEFRTKVVSEGETDHSQPKLDLFKGKKSYTINLKATLNHWPDICFNLVSRFR